MTIITDAASAGDIFEKYAVKAPLSITVISGDGDAFPPDVVKALLGVQANIVTVPTGASKMFAFGLAAGSESKTKDTYIVTADPEISKAAVLMGFQTQPPKKTETGRIKTQTAGKRVLKTKIASEANPVDKASARTGEETTKPSQESGNASTDKTEALIQTNSKTPVAETKPARKRTSKPKEGTEAAKKPAPKPETVYADNQEAVGKKPAAAFVKAVTKAGVNKEDVQGVWDAVVQSSAAIVYDMRLRLCLLDADKAKDIHEKTRDIFDELKMLTGGPDE